MPSSAGAKRSKKVVKPFEQHRRRQFAGQRQDVLADEDAYVDVAAAQHRADRLFDELRLPFLDDEDGAFAEAEGRHLVIHQSG